MLDPGRGGCGFESELTHLGEWHFLAGHGLYILEINVIVIIIVVGFLEGFPGIFLSLTFFHSV
jgi:hypothetical protein